MKKNGKKWRKYQKENESCRRNVKIGEPYSNQRKYLCLHYDGIPGGFIVGYCYSKLTPLNECECVCRECGKVFPIEKYRQMEQLVTYLTNKGCLTDKTLIKNLSKGLEPVYYCRISENEIKIIGIADV